MLGFLTRKLIYAWLSINIYYDMLEILFFIFYFLNDEEACDIIGLVIVEETRTIISRV